MRKFAFILLGNFDREKDTATIHNGDATIVGVSSIEEACTAAKELQKNGIECIELCGAFGEDGAREIIKATDNKIGVGYTIHLPEQDALYEVLFPN